MSGQTLARDRRRTVVGHASFANVAADHAQHDRQRLQRCNTTDPSGCRLGEANQDAVFQRVIMGRGWTPD